MDNMEDFWMNQVKLNVLKLILGQNVQCFCSISLESGAAKLTVWAMVHGSSKPIILFPTMILVPEGEAVPEELNDRFSVFDRVTSIKVDLILARFHNFMSYFVGSLTRT